MRKPENKQKFAAGIEALIGFYGRRDKQMVADVLREKAEKAKALEAEWWEKQIERKAQRRQTDEGQLPGRRRNKEGDGGTEGGEGD